MISFNADEVYEMAEQIERNGAAYYRAAAGSAGGDPIKQMLLELAVMEDDHEKTFHDMRQALTPAQRTEEWFDPSGEGALYLHAMVQGKVFDDRSEQAKRIAAAGDAGEILKTAIDMEKNSVVFYLTVKKMVTSEEAKAKVDEIIEQEVSHVATLSKQLAELS